VVTAQPNRTGKWLADKEFLSKYAIEWSGGAENGAEQLWALQYIEHAIDFEDKKFPVFDDCYYLISWLQRDGWKVQSGPGAVIFKDPVYGKDGQRRLWEGEAYGMKKPNTNEMIPTLWRPGASKAVGEKKSSRKMDKD